MTLAEWNDLRQQASNALASLPERPTALRALVSFASNPAGFDLFVAGIGARPGLPADRLEGAIVKTLALLTFDTPPTMPPPPDWLVGQIALEMRSLRADPHRAAELAIRTLLLRCPDVPGCAGLTEAAGHLTKLFLTHVCDKALGFLKRRVQELDQGLQPEPYAQEIFNRLTDLDLRCQCYRRSLPADADERPISLNHARRMLHCVQVAHWLYLWTPARTTLWDFLERSVRGTTRGQVFANDLERGMLWDRLLAEAAPLPNDPQHLRLVKLLHRTSCDHCGNKIWTTTAVCPECKATLLPSAAAGIQDGCVISDPLDGSGAFSDRDCWTCSDCGHVYPADSCGDACVCTGALKGDGCPKCSEGHDGRTSRVSVAKHGWSLSPQPFDELAIRSLNDVCDAFAARRTPERNLVRSLRHYLKEEGFVSLANLLRNDGPPEVPAELQKAIHAAPDVFPALREALRNSLTRGGYAQAAKLFEGAP